MSTDDPRATELLETAGDAYAASIAAIWGEQSKLVYERVDVEGDVLAESVTEDKLRQEAMREVGLTPATSPTQPTGTAPGAETPAGGGQVQNAEGKTNAEAPAPAESTPPAPQGDPKGRDEGNPPAAA
jgi:hypothetical protein